MPFRADLHTHSTCSDGSYTPQDLVELAKAKGLSALSITDHDTVEAYHQLDITQGIQIIPGVEFSTAWKDKSVHILGYGIDPASPLLLAFCAKHQERRKNRNSAILKLLSSHGMAISDKELYTDYKGTIGRPHIADLMVKKGYVADHKKAFQKYLGDGKCCFIPGAQFSLEETLSVIKTAGGLSVLAHPHLYHGVRFVKEVLQQGLQGIECDYACFPASKNAPWHKLAEQLFLLKTAGSDFHGEKKPGIPLGASCMDEKTFSTLIQSL